MFTEAEERNRERCRCCNCYNSIGRGRASSVGREEIDEVEEGSTEIEKQRSKNRRIDAG